eukprot:355524-Chlamydomonas_euryale.AAC.11
MQMPHSLNLLSIPQQLAVSSGAHACTRTLGATTHLLSVSDWAVATATPALAPLLRAAPSALPPAPAFLPRVLRSVVAGAGSTSDDGSALRIDSDFGFLPRLASTLTARLAAVDGVGAARGWRKRVPKARPPAKLAPARSIRPDAPASTGRRVLKEPTAVGVRRRHAAGGGAVSC